MKSSTLPTFVSSDFFLKMCIRDSFLLDWRYGGEVLSQTQAAMDLYGVSKATAQARDKGYVSLEGQQISDVKGFYKNVVGGRAGVTEYYMYDACLLYTS